jgi:hypothetical protein
VAGLVAFFVLVLALLVASLLAWLAAGVVTAFVVITGTLLGARSLRPETVTPVLVVDGSAPLPQLRDQAFPRDRAWPSYLSAQYKVDLGTAWRKITSVLAGGWRRIEDVDPPAVLLLAIPAWLAMSVGALVTAVSLLALCHLVLLAEWTGWIVVVGLLRGVDFVVRKRREADASCRSCHYVAARPCYACRCGEMHRDIRPGRLGGVWRRCGCGARLPTTVLRAARRLSPWCAKCGKPLHPAAGAVTDVRIPVFGPVSAGKTRLVYAGLLALRDAAAAAGGRLDFCDDESRVAFEYGAELITNGDDTIKTSSKLLPAISARLVLPTQRYGWLHMFDSGGEFYAHRDDNADLEFLDYAQGLVLVIDPFSIQSVRDQLGQATPAEARPATEDPEVVYQTTARRLKDFRVDIRSRWLAVTVVKADVLAGLPPAVGLKPGLVRQWLVDAGLDNMVLAAERDFGTIEYFVVASIPEAKAGVAQSPVNPLDWLLSRAGLSTRPAT